MAPHRIEVSGVSKRFGGARLFRHLSITMSSETGAIVGIAGPNGVGKSTLFRLLTGRMRPDAGSITVDGSDVTALRPCAVAQLGVAILFQENRLFDRLTPREHVTLGVKNARFLRNCLSALGSARSSPPEAVEGVAELLDGIARDLPVHSMSLGTRRKLALEMVFAARPPIVLLDEPTAGLDRPTVAHLVRLLHRYRDAGGLAVIVEHRPELMWELCDELHLLLPLVEGDSSEVVSGTPAEVRKNLRAERAYFGTPVLASRRYRPSLPPCLSLHDLDAGYPRIPAPVVSGVNLTLCTGELVGLVGRNGSGKSTLLRVLAGEAVQHSGIIELFGSTCGPLSPRALIRLGVAYVPEGRRVFASLTVAENLQVGYNPRQLADRWEMDHVFTLIPSLARLRDQRASTLSGGERQLLTLGMAIIRRPRILLLDEPTSGLAPKVAAHFFRTLSTLQEAQGTAMLIADHSPLLLDTANRVYSMANGRAVEISEAEGLETLRQQSSSWRTEEFNA